jgi:hypothetical protein
MKTRIETLESELRVVEAFRDVGRAQILRSMLQYEIKQEEFSHERSTRGSVGS